MASKTFNLGDGTESSGSCGKICMCLCGILIIGVIVVAAIYAYNSNYGGESGCMVPHLDENGLSNWTTSADTIAYACFPGFFLEGHSNIMIATCEHDNWVPSPPACNFLPLRLDCEVNYKGMVGNITMWQTSEAEPAHIYGLVDYMGAVRAEGHLLDTTFISKSSCETSNAVHNVSNSYPEHGSGAHTIKVEFNSTQLKAYNKAEIHINLIFVDNNTTATLVSVHQDNVTLVMPNSIPTTRWTREELLDDI